MTWRSGGTTARWTIETNKREAYGLPRFEIEEMRYGLFTCPYQRLPLERAFAAAIPPEVYDALEQEMANGG